MTLAEHLRSHKGCLIRLKTGLISYTLDSSGRSEWDKHPGRICPVLDAAESDEQFGSGQEGGYESNRAYSTIQFTTSDSYDPSTAAVALLLLDGKHRWVFVSQLDIEIIDPSLIVSPV